MAGAAITDYAILIDPTGSSITTLPTGTVRAAASGQSRKIIIGKAATMTEPFCNGIDAGGETGLLPFFALPASPNFGGQYVIIGINGSVPTYWGYTTEAALIERCTLLNGGSDTFIIGINSYNFNDEGNGAINCRLYLNENGYALSDAAAAVFLNSYFA